MLEEYYKLLKELEKIEIGGIISDEEYLLLCKYNKELAAYFKQVEEGY
jgi:hypothetical protein